MDGPAGTTFEIRTERLVAGEWHSLARRVGLDLADVVTTVLTSSTTAALPPDWQGDYDRERARAWLAERDRESPTLLAIDQTTGEAVGLTILFDTPADPADPDGSIDVRLGYVLAEHAWGRGLASELVAGIVAAARRHPNVATLSGGVAEENVASARVLERNGFSPTDRSDGETIYSIDVEGDG